MLVFSLALTWWVFPCLSNLGFVKASSGCAGCSNSATCDVEFVESAVYGCGGTWTIPGVSNAEYLCEQGYSVCDDADYAISLGLNRSICVQNDSIADNSFYLSGDSAAADQVGLDCSSAGANDVYGCGSTIVDNNWMWLGNEAAPVLCDPFGIQMSTDSGSAWDWGWAFWPDGWSETQELNQVTHEAVRNGDDAGTVLGGVMCCVTVEESTEEPMTTEEQTTEAPKARVDKFDVWRNRTIYQVLTDRFAVADGEEAENCTDLSLYCGGTFRGIIDKLDYISDLGFDAIWISPVVSNTENGYHGYWALDINEINPYFGSSDDLKNLSDALHAKGMVLIVDVVTNHMGYSDDRSVFNPFNDDMYFHDCTNETDTSSVRYGCATESCGIEDYENEIESQVCNLVGLPDLNTSSQAVIDVFCDWIVDLIETYEIDGLRIDTVKHVDYDFWQDFMTCVTDATDAGTFGNIWVTGEYFSGVETELEPYQSNEMFASLLSFPMYYTLGDVFGKGWSMIDQLEWRINNYVDVFGEDNYWLLGGFVDNHDVNRFLCESNSYVGGDNGLGSALVFLFTTNNVPILYYGTEQALSGCSDPENREALWQTGYDQENVYYVTVQLLNWARREYKMYDDDSLDILVSEHHHMVYRRGENVLVVLTNDYYSNDTEVTLSSTELDMIGDGTFCNLLETSDAAILSDCFDGSASTVTITLKYGISKVYLMDYTVRQLFDNEFVLGGSDSNSDNEPTGTGSGGTTMANSEEPVEDFAARKDVYHFIKIVVALLVLANVF